MQVDLSRLRIELVGIYFVCLLLMVRLAILFSPVLRPLLIWIGAAVIVFVIFLPRINQLKVVPRLYWYYGSLIMFSFLGSFQVIDFTGFFRYLQVLVSNLILMITIYMVVRSGDDWRRLVMYLWISVTALVVLGLTFFAGDSSDVYYRFAGLLDNSNGTATYARSGILAAFILMHLNKSLTWRMIYLGSILILSYAIILTASRGNLLNLGFILSAVVYARFFGGWKSLILVLLLFTSFSYLSNVIAGYLQDFYVFERLTRNDDLTSAIQNEGRFQLYINAFNIFLEHPFFGVGLNQFRQYSDGKISHTDILDILSQLGIMAGVFYIAIYVKLFNRLRKLLSSFGDKYLIKLLLITLISELIFGITNPNWFLQLDMIILSLLIVFGYKVANQDLSFHSSQLH